MAIKTISQLKAYFRKGQYPTESQFADVLDSFIHKGEKVELSQVDRLTEAINSKYGANEGKIFETQLQQHVATLDAFKKMQTHQSEDIAELQKNAARRVIYIDGWVDGVDVEEGVSGSTAETPLHHLVYNAATKRLLLAGPDLKSQAGAGVSTAGDKAGDVLTGEFVGNADKPGGTGGFTGIGKKYYADWADASLYGEVTDTGVKLSKGRIYVASHDEFDDGINIFLWTGDDLVSLHFKDLERLDDKINHTRLDAHRFVLIDGVTGTTSYDVVSDECAPDNSYILLDEDNDLFVAKSGGNYYADWSGANDDFGSKANGGRQPKVGRMYLNAQMNRAYFTDDGVTVYSLGGEDIATLEKKIRNVENNYINNFDKSQTNKTLDDNGNEAIIADGEPQQYITPFIPIVNRHIKIERQISSIETYNANSATLAGAQGVICYYNIAKKHIGTFSVWADYTTDANYIPEEAVFFRAAFLKSEVDSKDVKIYSGNPTNIASDSRGAICEAIMSNVDKTFIDLWNNAAGEWGRYNAETGCFELNGLTDITYEEAIEIYNAGIVSVPYPKLNNRGIRTNLVSPNIHTTNTPYEGYDFNDVFYMSTIEVANIGKKATETVFAGPSIKTITHHSNVKGDLEVLSIFQNCTKLKKIIGQIRFNYVDKIDSHNEFSKCYELEDLEIIGLKTDLYLNSCPKLSYNSVYTLFTRKSGTVSINVRFHEDVYAKIIGDTTNAAAAALSTEELAQWTSLLDLATSKNITLN